jgi:hypothetical protein
MKTTILITSLFLLIFQIAQAECEKSAGDKRLATYYTYGEKWSGTVHIAAVVCWNGVRVAKATAVDIDKTCGTPYCMKILETHWDGSGNVITYEGGLLIQLGSFGTIKESFAMTGEKNMQFFSSWP